MAPIDVMRIMEMIPHRYPFLLVDRIVELEIDKSAVGIKNVTINESFFQGHFPRQPIMPGVLIVEAMAQTAAVLVVQTLESDAAGKLVYFMTINEARFRKPVSPGDTLKIHVEKLRSRGNVWKFSGEVRVEGTLVASARFAAMIMDD
ncbi:MAG: 3-hydroxyacyl-ACP dehydratase FabZ [Rhodospirillales bacterium]|nr:3-hydroxyacyl-ACP dehydratase FabZ [Rhodospirillales bacterium]MDH3910474.1 3-hydroxyacyl-ACP dehydratase FabZ [Rhodospirillales bacterium]MDH3921167.1 3-hydroxyacyl-ACP dehydratase FabZ [Rhodospirillales bacterium]MDH3966006.1 3-hydroxyacyl-ACP dehydratase FabZ [Rhodospirillales bacterium]